MVCQRRIIRREDWSGMPFEKDFAGFTRTGETQIRQQVKDRARRMLKRYFGYERIHVQRLYITGIMTNRKKGDIVVIDEKQGKQNRPGKDKP